MCVAEMIDAVGWAVREQWNPLSPPQVMKYLRHRKYRIPTERSSGKPTTNDEGISGIIAHQDAEDPVLHAILRLRRLRKGIGYLADTYLGKDEKFHPLFTFIPKTGRLSAKAPNTMNQPQGRGSDVEREIAEAIRSSFLPFPGDVLMEFDWRAIEALLVGFFADDPTYIRASKLDIHSALAAHLLQAEGRLNREMFSWDWPDEELIRYFAAIKKEFPADRDRAKKKNHAGNYGQGARNLAKDLECSYAEAKALNEITDKAWPKIPEWRHKTRMQAHYEGQLVNPFGYPLSFFEVFTSRDGKWVPGKEANECLAFLPQSTGAAMLREILIDVIDAEGRLGYKLLSPVHDSVLLSVPREQVEATREFIVGTMSRSWPQLGGLVVEVETKIGEHLGAMRGV
jgi:DNA polymerase I-like protein with 3'-5' exonuclease and polymerase domains